MSSSHACEGTRALFGIAFEGTKALGASLRAGAALYGGERPITLSKGGALKGNAGGALTGNLGSGGANKAIGTLVGAEGEDPPGGAEGEDPPDSSSTTSSSSSTTSSMETIVEWRS